MQHDGPPEIEAGAGAGHIIGASGPQLFIEERRHVLRENPARRQLVAVSRFRQERLTPQLFGGGLDRLFERQMLEGVQRIVVDKNADRALRRQQLCHLIDHTRESVRRAGIVGAGTVTHQNDDCLRISLTARSVRAAHEGHVASDCSYSNI